MPLAILALVGCSRLPVIRIERPGEATRPQPPIEVYEGPTSPRDIEPETYVSYALYLESGQNFAGAREAYEAALERDRRCVAALVGLGRLAAREGDAAACEQYCRRALELEPESPAVLNDLGQCRALAGNWSGAAEAYARAVARAGQRPLYRNNLAVALFHCGRWEEAFQQFAAVSGEASAHYNLGVLLAREGAHVESSRQFVLALLRDPSRDEARRWLDYLAAHGAISPDVIPQDPRTAPFGPAPVRHAERDRGVIPSGHQYVPDPDVSAYRGRSRAGASWTPSQPAESGTTERDAPVLRVSWAAASTDSAPGRVTLRDERVRPSAAPATSESPIERPAPSGWTASNRSRRRASAGGHGA